MGRVRYMTYGFNCRIKHKGLKRHMYRKCGNTLEMLLQTTDNKRSMAYQITSILVTLSNLQCCAAIAAH